MRKHQVHRILLIFRVDKGPKSEQQLQDVLSTSGLGAIEDLATFLAAMEEAYLLVHCENGAGMRASRRDSWR